VTEALLTIFNSPDFFWKIYKVPNEISIQILVFFAVFQLLLWILVPGQWWKACVSPAGLRPTYKLNGSACYWITLAAWYIGGVHLKLFSPSIVYDNFAQMLTFLCFFSLIVCFILYLKGLYFPSSADSGTTGHFLRDLFWGTELHPAFFGYTLKQYVNCRLSMTGWIVILLSFAYKQYELYGYVSNSMAVSVALQTLYIGKFFLWEHGYFNSIDIMHDRFGFYIYWGVTVWVPGLYTLAVTYLVKHPNNLSIGYASFCFFGGLLSLYLNYASDEQRLRFRETNGNTTIWGKKPEFIKAKYTTTDGVERESILLVSGFWGVSRHFNYIPELSLALCWSLPALFDHIIPYVYFVFLTILLVHRSKRDEERCQLKYGQYFTQYKKRVPYSLIPYIY
jgi:7-dehydrocholesterol reductase